MKAARRPRAAAQRRLARIDVELVSATPMGELKLVQERRDLRELDAWYPPKTRSSQWPEPTTPATGSRPTPRHPSACPVRAPTRRMLERRQR
jgi:hypothetical protein